ncbi:YhcH/YjgK/YiaL family protein, partial [Phocaeicola sp.]|uniref:YhcH/YjgK/YiaL family protein n=1 Tax=Phocaeicola sp. TaxID=2773926 RepID=UPI003AB884D7
PAGYACEFEYTNNLDKQMFDKYGSSVITKIFAQHKDYIDIQIPLSGTEIMGYTAAQDCLPVDAPYNAEKDITFFEGLAEDYIAVKPGMFAIFFPQDGHAPGITPDGVKKIIVKVKA